MKLDIVCNKEENTNRKQKDRISAVTAQTHTSDTRVKSSRYVSMLRQCPVSLDNILYNIALDSHNLSL